MKTPCKFNHSQLGGNVKRIITLLLIIVTNTIIFSGYAMAFIAGDNITISDDNTNTSANSWYNSPGEDQEVEPGMIASQAWDLEGFFLNGSMLAMIGGFDFKFGKDGFTSGDIFIDTDGDAAYGQITRTTGNGNNTVTNTYGYDYAIDLNFSAMTYNVYQLNSSSQLLTAYYNQNDGSSPWAYKRRDDESEGIIGINIPFYYTTGLSNEINHDVSFLGETHNAVYGIDLSAIIGNDQEFIAHFTMGCGNDNLMGRGTTPLPNPEPATMLLFGTGLIGLAGLTRKKIFKA